MTVCCIVQARMTSKRFPGKVAATLAGAPVLQHVLERAKMIPGVGKVICAFPDDEASKPIIRICRDTRVIAFSGSEHDVLERYFEAATEAKASMIMRVTGDCPFIDPGVCAQVLQLALFGELDYASNVFPSRSYPKGLDCEVFTFDCLEAAHLNAKSKYDREHVTPWMQKTDGIDRGTAVAKQPNPTLNLCVDYPEDIKRLEKLMGDVIGRRY